MPKQPSAKLAASIRWVAAFAAAMVMFLSLAGYSPELHDAICHHRHDPVSEPLHMASTVDCAVVHYGEGEVLLIEAAPVIGPDIGVVHVVPRAVGALLLTGADWLIPPGRGPPEARA